jgi:hypothetical protein
MAMDKRKKEYLNILKTVARGEKSKSRKDVVKLILRLYSDTCALTGISKAAQNEIDRRKNAKKQNIDAKEGWIDLSIHHKHEIAKLADDIFSTNVKALDILEKSGIRFEITKRAHARIHKMA